jgi:uncharacterized protein
MNRNNVIRQVEGFAKNSIAGFDGGHDWWHLDRVRNLALIIQSKEGVGDRFLIEIAALLHDIDDKKFGSGHTVDTAERISSLLLDIQVENRIIQEVININKYISFSSAEKPAVISDELMIVQDADRLDAIGAIGIARAFNYGGFINNPVFDPSGQLPSTIKHFYDKLLKLKGLMNTETGGKLAAERHEYMEEFLKQFYRECEFAGQK